MIPGQNSTIYDPSQPPGMSPESQSPPWWKVAEANTQQAMGDPRQRVMMAMLARQMERSRQQLAGRQPAPMRRNQMFDMYGNPLR